MNNIFPSLASIMVTLFLLMATGFACRKIGWMDEVASKKFSRLIISVGQPLLIVGSLNNAEYSEENLRIALWSTLIGFAMHTFLGFSAFLICRAMGNTDRARIFEFGLIFANCGFLGFPVLDSIFGAGVGSFMGAFYVISFHLYLWTWGISVLGRGREDIRLTPKKALLNYGTIPTLAGVVLYLLKAVVTVPEAIGKVFTYLGGLCTPISLLITGGLLATVSVRKILATKSLYLHCAISLILIPMVVCVICRLIRLPDNYLLFCTVMAGLPAASTVCMLSELYNIDPPYASQIVGTTSLLTTVTLPLVVLFAQWVMTWQF